MLKLTGAMFLALGLAAGAALVVSPFGLLSPARSSLAAWILFPASFAAGSVLLALAAPTPLGWLWRFCAAALLGLASASAVGLMLPLLGVLEPALPDAVALVRARARGRARDRVCAGTRLSLTTS